MHPLSTSAPVPPSNPEEVATEQAVDKSTTPPSAPTPLQPLEESIAPPSSDPLQPTANKGVKTARSKRGAGQAKETVTKTVGTRKGAGRGRGRGKRITFAQQQVSSTEDEEEESESEK